MSIDEFPELRSGKTRNTRYPDNSFDKDLVALRKTLREKDRKIPYDR